MFLNSFKHLLVIFIFLSLQSFSQSKMEFNYIGGKQGLSENVVNQIVQDNNGFIWLATNDGLNRYDGYSMTHFRYEPATANSLSSNVVQCLSVDQKGMLWIGTSDGGLNKYDMKTNTFQRFQNDPSDNRTIASGLIDDIVEDTDGNIWINIRDKGIDRLEISNGRTEFIHYRSQKLGNNFIDILKSTQSIGIEKARNGGIWVSSESGLQKIYADKKKADNLNNWKNHANQPVKDIEELPGNKVWIIYNSGEILYGSIVDDNNSEKSQFILKKRFKTQPINDKISASIDQSGTLWAGSNSGLIKIGPEGLVKYLKDERPLNNLLTDHILCTYVDQNNLLWLGTYNYGALFFDINSPIIYNFDDLMLDQRDREHFFFNYPVHSFCKDKWGALWIGTEGGGIMRIHNGIQSFINRRRKATAQVDFFNTKLDNKSLLLDDYVYQLFCDSKGKIWIGSRKGVTQVTIKSSYSNTTPLTNHYLEIKHFQTTKNKFNYVGDGAVYAIAEDVSGTIWIGTWDKGIQRHNDSTGQFEPFLHNPSVPGSLSQNTVRAILFEPNGEAWIGTAGGGLNKMIFPDKRNKMPYFISYKNDPKDKRSLSNNYILNLAKDNQGNLWIGTFGGGLNKMVRSTDNDNIYFKRYTTTEGLPNNTIKGLLFDEKGNLRASTNRDLFLLNTETDEISLVMDYQKNNLDEFKDNSNYSCEDGFSLWGGISGLVLLSNEAFKNRTYSIDVCITDILIDNVQMMPSEQNNGDVVLTKSIQFTDKIVLPNDKNTIELHFSGMLFADPGKMQYKYYLEGYDDNWVTTSRGSVRYTKIPYGDYKFHVIASSNGADWGGQEKLLSITISPPYWLSFYAYIIYGILIFAIGYTIYRIIAYRVQLKSQIKIEHIKREQAEKNHNSKLQFFTNVSHELRTPLSLISGPIEKLISDSDLSPAQHKLLMIVQRNSVRLQNLINQLLDFRKMESAVSSLKLTKSDIVPFTYDIYRAFENIAFQKQINYRFSCKETKIECLFDEDKIEKIIFNLLSNAFKFTPPHGSVVFSLGVKPQESREKKSKSENFLIFEIIDTGIGIPENVQKNIFTRFYQVDDPKKGKMIGTGIGLSHTKNLVHLHHGKIKVKSETGMGAHFSVYIPLDEKEYNKYSVENVSIPEKSVYLIDQIKGLEYAVIESGVTSSGQELKRKEYTILLVEDNKELLFFLKEEFSNDYNILTATNGLEGVNKTKEYLPDLIISDVMMPELNGIEMCSIIKSEIITCHIPIVILTAKTGLEEEKEGLETGADEYVLKPFNMDLLKLRVRNLLQTKRMLFEQFRNKSDQLIFKKASDSNDKEFLEKVIEVIKNNLDDTNFNVDELSKGIGYSRSALYKRLKNITDMSTTEFIRYIKLEEATYLFKQNLYTIEQVTHMVGFSDPKYFRNCFKKIYGQNPSEFIKSIRDNL